VVHDLMPVSTEAPRCSEFARSIGVLPPGTGLFLDRVVLVSSPLPWPKPALNHEWLKPSASLLGASSVTSRLFAAEPVGDDVLVEVYERQGPAAVLYRWKLAGAEAIASVVASVANAAVGELGDIEVADVANRVAGDASAPTFLVCTQGSHDSCCGTSGVALADEIDKSRPDYVVRRVSHTGGHRFSPTFLAFPEGRMWAFADLALVDRIASNAATPDDYRHHARGWWGAKVGPAQVAECAVRSELADQPFVEPQVKPVNGAEGRAATQFAVTVEELSWLVDVRVERNIPTIACESPGGLPVKPGREFAWSITRR
jgi:hypothetical protein